MPNNNHNNSPCAFAEQMISYLYGEDDAREKIKFETHLKNCSTCADELAAFGFVRSAVLDWRAEGFSKLPTPAFEIPTSELKESFSTTVVSNGNRSWFGEFRQMFSFNLMKAATAFGVLIVCAGIAWFAFNFSGDKEITGNGEDKTTSETVVSPTVQVTENPKETSVVVKDDENSSPSPVVANLQPPIRREKSESPNKSIIKVSGNAPKNNSDSFARNSKETNESIKKITPVQKKRIPNLNDAEDVEDETIRLADLFDELGAK